MIFVQNTLKKAVKIKDAMLQRQTDQDKMNAPRNLVVAWLKGVKEPRSKQQLVDITRSWGWGKEEMLSFDVSLEQGLIEPVGQNYLGETVYHLTPKGKAYEQ